MADQNVFEKIHIDERDKADLSGVLEQLNLPPVVVEYVRRNQKTIYICLTFIAIVVVTWSLYGSYVENKIAKSSSALTVAMKVEEGKKIPALQDVIDQFSGTDSALWAQIEIAQMLIDEKKYSESLTKYSSVKNELDKDDALYPLVVFGIAQAEEALSNFDKALQEYSVLKAVKGYEGIAYNSIARIYEIQKKFDDAVKTLEEYQGVLISDIPNSPEKESITSRITRIKAQM